MSTFYLKLVYWRDNEYKSAYIYKSFIMKSNRSSLVIKHQGKKKHILHHFYMLTIDV